MKDIHTIEGSYRFRLKPSYWDKVKDEKGENVAVSYKDRGSHLIDKPEKK